MNCERIQELLVTDYIDGQLDEQIAEKLEKHLAVCAQCQAFERAVQEYAVQPFSDAGEVHPPAVVWQHIKESIARDAEAKHMSIIELLSGFIRTVLDSLRVGKPAFVFAGALAIVLVIMLTTQVVGPKEHVVEDYFGDHISFLVSLENSNGNSDAYESDEASFGTAIEQMFM